MKAGTLLQYFSVQTGNAASTKEYDASTSQTKRGADDAHVQAEASKAKAPSYKSERAAPDSKHSIVQVDETNASTTTTQDDAPSKRRRRSDRISTSAAAVEPRAKVDSKAQPDKTSDIALKDATNDIVAEVQELMPRPTQPQPELSEYEQHRLAKIQQNASFLASLGMDKLIPSQPAKKAPAAKKPRKSIGLDAPLRRSTRQQPSTGGALKEDASASVGGADDAGPMTRRASSVPDEPVDTTALFNYMCDRRDRPGNSTANPSNFGTDVIDMASSLQFTTDDANDRSDGQLKRVYSMDATPELLVAAGHNGYVSIYSSDPSYQAAPLHSFRAHQGWCSGVNFKLSTRDTTRVITAANDGLVKLWSLSSVRLKTLMQVASTATLHASGIFSIDVEPTHQLVATGSKDQTVGLSIVTPTTIQLSHTLTHHAGVVKCVRFAPTTPSLLASCGNDLVVHVHDVRTRDAPAVTLRGHTRAVNSVRWAPVSNHRLVSTAFDGCVHVWDTRHPAAPAITYATPEFKKMFPVEFTHDATLVAGVDAALLVLDASVRRTHSRGALAYDPETIFVQSMPSAAAGLVVAHRQTLSWFQTV
ncbi:Aste57867_22258 [Aphanomyces stellatus]|uniref:Aste57867_22258 protein n=1 Tax=Aphanomyces stellatus TaxID=120398 RepID=A0A485LJV6_9STRA|nr:hypothetical protein As57867_022188 [Aphanomyces stellatus]VFT98925.1 Aste57867_22258 [Aphanomyces stellatus]